MAGNYRILFVPSKDDRDPETALLRCRLTWDGSRTPVSLNVGFRVNLAKWDSKEQRCVRNSFHGKRRIPAATINHEIDRFSDAAAATFRRFKEPPTPDQLRRAFRAELGLDLPTTPAVLDALDEFTSEQSRMHAWAKSTTQKFRQLRGHLVTYGRISDFEDVTVKNLLGFVDYLQDECGFLNSTTNKYIGYIRWFLKWAEERRYLASTDWKYFNPHLKSVPPPVVYLTWEELMRVWDYEAPPGHAYLNDVRDIFLFCAFTSLRYSDAVNARWADFEGNVLKVTTVKTSDPVRIDMNKWSNQILARHIGKDYGKDRVFRPIPNQVMNRYLKQICRELGINAPVRITTFKGSERTDEVKEKWEVIGTHAGRRTFIVNALSMGISPQVVMKWTGHADYKSMKPYIDVTDAARADAMGKFDER